MASPAVEEWRHWQRSRMPWPRRVADRVRRHRPEELALVSSGEQPRVLAALDSLGPSEVAAVLEPLSLAATRAPVAALLPRRLVERLAPVLRATVRPWEESAPPEVQAAEVEAAITIGEHLACGQRVHSAARRLGIPQYVVQHGLVTPFSPPPPEGSIFLAWNDEDRDLAAREAGSAVTVGGQLLWKAAHAAAPGSPEESSAPLFLGQLHGAELDRAVTVRTVKRLAGEGPLIYRRHPAERDVLSRLQHRRWARHGVELDLEGRPLAEIDRPVLGIFSTGLVEAAAAGRPARAACVGPPQWVEELWERYSISRHGNPQPTPPPALPAREPAFAIAELLLG